MSRRDDYGIGATFASVIGLLIGGLLILIKREQRKKARKEAEERWASYAIPDELIHV